MKHARTLVGCGAPPTSAAPTPPPALAVAPPPTEAPDIALEPDVTPVPEVPAAPAVAPDVPLVEVDLLHALPARLAVSSAYHDDARQIVHLVDGDLESAWNSRSGDLVGAWIEVAVPADATVRAIAMTVGFTHTTDRSDLFVGNHRVSRVRVSQGGVALGEQDLDTSSRSLVEIPVGGAGGALRVEVLRTLPGDHADWREICVSELRVLGTAASAHDGAFTPTTAIGALPAEASTEDAADPAEDAMLGALDAEDAARGDFEVCNALLSEWQSYAVYVSATLENDATDRLPPALAAQFAADREAARGRHSALFAHAASAFAPASAELAADATTRAQEARYFWSHRDSDFGALVTGCDAVMARHSHEQCDWAETRAMARLDEIVDRADERMLELEGNVDARRTDEGPLRGEALEAERASLATATAFQHWLGHIHADEWIELGRRQRSTLLAGDVPAGGLQPAWDVVRADVERADTACASGH